MGGGMEEVGGGMKTVSLGGASGHVPGLEGGRGGEERSQPCRFLGGGALWVGSSSC